MSYFRQFVIAVVLVLVMVVAVKLQIDINELNEKNQQLKKQAEDLQYEIEKKENELSLPMDDEYIKKVASDKLGLKHNEWQYFYSDSPN